MFASQAQGLIQKLRAAEKLTEAIASRKIPKLEGALDAVKKGGWEKEYTESVTKADTLLEKVRNKVTVVTQVLTVFLSSVFRPTFLELTWGCCQIDVLSTRLFILCLYLQKLLSLVSDLFTHVTTPSTHTHTHTHTHSCGG